MSKIDEKISKLSPEKKAMLEKLLREKKLKQTKDISKIKPIQLDNNRYPITFAQEKIGLQIISALMQLFIIWSV